MEEEEQPMAAEAPRRPSRKHRSTGETCAKFRKHLGDPFVTLVWSCLTVISWFATALICAFYMDDFAHEWFWIVEIGAIIFMFCGVFGIVATAKCTRWWPGAWVFMIYTFLGIIFLGFLCVMVIVCQDPPDKDDCEDGNGKWDKEKCEELSKCHEFSLLFQNEEGNLLFLFWALMVWAFFIMCLIAACAVLYFKYELMRRKANGLKACCRKHECKKCGSKEEDEGGDDEAPTEEDETETDATTEG